MEVKREWFDKDYYAVLGVAPSASEKEIQQAYRKLARELHPDANPDDAAAEDASKRCRPPTTSSATLRPASQYDQARAMGPGGPQPLRGRRGPWRVHVRCGDLGDLNDLLGGMFGGGGQPFGGQRGGPRPHRGRDQEAQLRLSFDEAVDGVTTSVTVGGGADGGTRTIKVRIPAGVEDGQRIRLKEKGGPGAPAAPAATCSSRFS